MLRSCQFVKIPEGVAVPSPDSWLGGWARQRWLERYFGSKIQIRNVNAVLWAELFTKNTVYLLEEEQGIFAESVFEK